MHPDKADLHIIWKHTDARIDTLRSRVREGVDVSAASEFARWLLNSGVLKFLPEQGFPLPCRAQELRSKVDELVMECGEWFSNHERSNVKPHPQIPRTELERINEQLAALTAQLANLSAPPERVPLRVIEGGVESQ